MNNDKKIKMLGAIVGIIMFIVLIAGATYAWVTWQSDNTRLSGNTGCFPDINYVNGNTLSSNNVLLFDESLIINNNKIIIKNGMTYLNVTASVDSNCTLPVQLRIDFNVSELNKNFIDGNSTGAFSYILAKYDGTVADLSEFVGKSLDIIESGIVYNKGDYSVLGDRLTTDTSSYLLIFYINGDNAFDDVAYSNFSVSIKGSVQSMDR